MRSTSQRSKQIISLRALLSSFSSSPSLLFYSLPSHFHDILVEVLDETGCGDTFLTCAVLEILLHKRNVVKSPGGGTAGGYPFPPLPLFPLFSRFSIPSHSSLLWFSSYFLSLSLTYGEVFWGNTLAPI